MKDQFIPYEHAKMMKELGFDEICIAYFKQKEFTKCPWDRAGLATTNFQHSDFCGKDFTNISNESKYVSAPLYQQAEEWLWEKHGIQVRHEQWASESLGWNFSIRNKEGAGMDDAENFYNSPVTAHREGTLKAIEYLHSQKK